MRLDARRDNVFSTRDEAIHADLRSKMIGGVGTVLPATGSTDSSQYQGRDIDSLEPDIDARIGDFVGLIKNTYDRKSFDITKQAQYFTLDVLSTVAFGAPFGFLKANAVSSAPQLALVSIKSQDAECQVSQVVLADTSKDIYDLAKANAQFQPIIALITEHSILRWLFLNPIVRKLTSPKETDLVGLGPIVKAARNAVGERFGPDAKEKRDMLGHFKEKGLDQLQCEAEANLQILAGSDSTTTILRCLLFMLTATPAAYAKLRYEIDTAVAEGNLSFPVATYAETQKLPYLGVCILEGIRMYPPLVGLKGKLSPRGGDTINGQYIPEGTEVAVCDIAMCRKKEVFGEDSHIFRPDRWVEADAQTRQRYQTVVDSVFGGGKWTCLGKHIAMLELHKVFTEVSIAGSISIICRLTIGKALQELRLGDCRSNARRPMCHARHSYDVRHEHGPIL